MKILFLTTHNLATNPRLVKEIDLALEAGYTVELVCFEFDNWSFRLNQQLKEKFAPVKMNIIPAGRKPFLPWFINTATETAYRFAGKMLSLPLPLLSQAVSRRSNILIAALMKVEEADLVIGHNLGALYPALVAAAKMKCKAGFDMEDYHSGEGSNSYLQGLAKELIRMGLHKFQYISYASPLIKKQVEKDLRQQVGNGITILNMFHAAEFEIPEESITGPMRMVWFSQNITSGRGLELVLPTIEKHRTAVELHLIGHLNESFAPMVRDLPNIVVHAPMSQVALHRSLNQYDIGLALEPAKDLNNELAISNKLIAGLQAGLYIVATDTPAQEDYLRSFPGHGSCFSHKQNNFEPVFLEIAKNLNSIRQKRLDRYQQFKKFEWGQEAKQLSHTWKSIIH